MKDGLLLFPGIEP